MALHIVNSGNDLPPDLLAAARGLKPGRPVIVMIHGYRFCPASPAHDPHQHILSLTPGTRSRRAMSWPAALGLSAHGPEGLGVAFGWRARGPLREAYARAGLAGRDLARLASALSDASGRPVHLIGHSLGGRVALEAMRRAAPGEIGRLILLSAAELRGRAERALDAPASAAAEIINVTSRENDLFDFGLELMIGRMRRPALGLGLPTPRANWLDIQIDDPATRRGLAALGYEIAPGAQRACHWSAYLREGVFALYRAALHRPAELPLALLRQHLPQRPLPRWSRLLSPPALPRLQIGLRPGAGAV
ncbi:MAG: hypothetical protein Q4F71_05075 [Paracoccus sp. (in: a-proteobacteria)]|nr:hypothetical protein [Paracoccus sp. (in: a-proteobacteria)]